jgi:hypothetical protein
MSTSPQSESTSASNGTTSLQPDVPEIFKRLVDKLIRDPQLCAWCFAKRRRIHAEYDELRDERIRHSTLQVITATSSPDPATYSEVVPPKKDAEQPWIITEPPRPRCICGDCASIDVDLDCHRDNATLVLAVRNGISYLNDEYDRELCADSAADRVREITSSGRAGHEQTTLAAGFEAAFEHASE